MINNMSKNIQIVQLREHDLNRGASKDSTPVFPITKASAIEGMSEFLRDLNINGVTPISDISDVNSPEKGKIYYEESTDKYYVYNEAQSNFVELGAGPSVDPSDLMPTITQEASTQSGGNNIITFTFPNGDTTQVIIKNGTQGNSGYTGAVGELEVVNNLKDGGATAALSAEMGKELAQQSLIESGTFAKAYLKAVDVNVPFPWVLKDTDGNGNSITKMIWHIGNREFVDAAGADVNWYKDGITVITDSPCCLHVTYANNQSSYKNIIIPKAGLTTIPFSELKRSDSDTLGTIRTGYFIKTTTEIVDGEETIIPVPLSNQLSPSISDMAIDILYVNFGGLTVTYKFSFGGEEYSKLKAVDNLIMQGSTLQWNYWLQRCPNIKHIGNIRGTLSWDNVANGVFAASLGGLPNITKLEVPNLVCPMLSISMSHLNYLDVRGMNPKLNKDYANNTYLDTYTLNSNFLTGTDNLRTLVIGDFDTSNITGVNSGKQFIGSLTNCTLVCTKQTPPATNQQGFVIDDLLNKVTTILVPPGAKAAYQAADWWGDYASKMSEYNEGEY